MESKTVSSSSLTDSGLKMGYMDTNERIRRLKKKKWCAVTQTKFRENDSQYLYSDCAYQREPEPHEFPHGIGLHYPIIPRKGMHAYNCPTDVNLIITAKWLLQKVIFIVLVK